MELICKDALLKELGITNEDCEKCAWGDGYGYCTRDSDFTDACDAICTAPVIEERKTGKWLPDNTNMYEIRFVCSNCKESQVVPTIGYKPIWDWCPRCGCKMEGEQP